MPPAILRSYLAGTRRSALWLEYERYAWRVFANSAADWLTQATRFANTLTQAHKALPTDVLSVDITAAGLAVTAGGMDPVARCRAALENDAARRYTTDCIAAILHKLGDEVDLVLRAPAPRDLLIACGCTDTPDFDALDEVGTALTAALRAYADKSVAGVLLMRRSPEAPDRDETDAWEPIWNAARHYGWVTSLVVDAGLVSAPDSAIDGVDLLLCAALPLERIRELRRAGLALGGGLGAEVFGAGGCVPARDEADLLFGEIPEDATPETVLARCAALAA